MAYDKDIVLSVGLEPENVTETAKKLNDDIDQIFQKTSGHGNKLSTSFKSLQMQMDKTRQRSVELQKSIANLQNTKIPTSTLVEYDNQIDAAVAQRSKINNKMRSLEAAGKTDYAEYKRLGKELDSVNAKYDKLVEARQKYVLAGNAFTDAKDTGQFKSLVADLNEVNNRMVILKQRAQETSQINLSGLIGTFQRLGSSILNISRTLGNGALNVVTSTFSRLGTALGTVATKARSTATSLAKMAGKTIINGIKKLASAITSLHKAGNKSNNIFNGGFKAFLKYGLGVRSLFALMRKLRSALADGFKELAQVHEPFNRAMSQLMTSLKYLRDSFVSAFAPIIQTIAPVLSRFINLVAEAVNKVGMLISALTGKEYVKAIPVYQDYAESTKTAAEKAKEAAKAEKERKKQLEKLKRTIAGFDDVEILKGPDDDEEEEEETTTPSFVTSPILDSMKDFAQKLLDMWKNADFTELGRMIGQRLLDALNKIPWAKIKKALRKIAKSIATFLNGFLETPGLFRKIGETLAEALNSAFEFLHSFITNFHWDSLGKAIRDAILGFLDTIDWDLIFDTLKALGRGLGTTLENAFDNQEIWTKIFKSISRGINALIYGLIAFVTSVDWGSIARHIAEGLNHGVEEIDWDALARLLIENINAIFDAWYNFVTTFDFFKFGKHIGETIAQAIRNIDWEKGGMSVAETINGLFEALNGFIQGIDWADLGNSIKEFLLGALTTINWTTIYDTASRLGSGIGTAIQNAVNDPQVWTEVFNFLARGLNATVYNLTAFVQSINWGELGHNIATGLNNAVHTINWDAIANLLSTGINAVFDLWYNFVTTFDFKEFGEHIGTALSTAVNDIDWEKGGYSVGATVSGLLEALNGFAETTDWEAIGRAVVDAISGFLDGIDWHTLGAFASNCLHALLGTLTGAIEEVDWASVPNEIGTMIGDFLVGFDWSTAASDAMELFGAACAAAVLLVGGLAGAIADWIKTGLSEMWDFFDTEIEDAGGDIGQGILNGLADVFKNIGGWLYDNIILPITEGLASTVDIRSIVSNMFGVELPMIQDYSEALEGLAAASDSAGNTDSWKLLGDALQIMHDNGTLSDEALQNMNKTIENLSGRLTPFSDATEAVNTALSKNEVNATALNGALSSLPGYTDKVVSSFQNLSSDSETASTHTGEVASVLDSFDGLSLATPIKLALIRAAIENLGSKGELSEEQVGKLHDRLDSYNPYVPESKLSDLGGAFEDAGVSAEEFANLMVTSVEGAQKDLGSEFDSILDDVKKLGTDLKASGTDSGEDLGNGMVDGMESTEKDIKNKAKDLVDKDILQIINDTADIHSPSKETQKRGEYLGDGLIEGLKSKEKDIKTKATDIIKTDILATMDNDAGMKSSASSETQKRGQYLGDGLIQGLKDRERQLKDKSSELIKTDILSTVDTAAGMRSSASSEMQKRGNYLVDGLLQGMRDLERSVVNLVDSAMRSALNTVQGYAGDFQNAGSRITESIASGMSNNAGSINYAVQNIVNQIRDAFSYNDWSGLGHNIGAGIYNGLAAEGGSLNILAHNLAVGMYNSMVSALQIHSPSKKFAWIGKMTMLGLGEGIEDNEKFVSDTVQDVTDTIEDKASRAKATINLDTNMEEVLASFSDTIVDEFDRLISTLQALTNFTVGALPSVVQGKVVPYSSGYTNDKYDNTNEELLNELDYINAHQLSIDDLESFLEPLFRRYLNISLYLGDEQIARHANAGNLKLERRYNT